MNTISIKRSKILLLLLFPIVTCLIYTACPNRILGDSIWAVHISMSILQEGNTDLNEYCKKNCPNDYRLLEHNGAYYSYFPDATSIISVPVVFLLEKISPSIWGYRLSDHIKDKIHWCAKAQRLISSLYLAVAVALFIALLCSLTDNMAILVLGAVLFAFGTTNFSVVSRVLWTHGLSIVCNTAALLLLFRNSRRSLALAGLPLMWAFFIRPTNAVPLAVFGCYMLFHNRKTFLLYCLTALLAALPFLLYNLHQYDTLLTPYFHGGRLAFHDLFFVALAGNLFSTARGLFVFSPLLLLSIHGCVIVYQQYGKSLAFALLAIVGLHWIAISLFPHWWAGHSFGPRLFSDIIPYLCLLTFFSVRYVFSRKSGARSYACKSLILLFLGISIFIHARGAIMNSAWKWNVSPNIETHQERLWSIRCPQFFCTDSGLKKNAAAYTAQPEGKK